MNLTPVEAFRLATIRLRDAQIDGASIAVLNQLEAEYNLARRAALAGNTCRRRQGDVEGAILARQEAEGGEVFYF